MEGRSVLYVVDEEAEAEAEAEEGCCPWRCCWEEDELGGGGEDGGIGDVIFLLFFYFSRITRKLVNERRLKR